MNKSTLLLVKANAQLLISRIDKVLVDIPDTSNWCYSSKFTAALKRTSMELTRSLTDLRQNR
jgi:hypothetical protein